MPVAHITLRIALPVAATVWATSAAVAGPCTGEIIRVQAQVDAAIAANAGSGGFGPQSTAATRSYQPTPKSVAAAAAQINKWTGGENAVAALEKARAADQAGDGAACDLALAEAKAALTSPR